MAETDNRITALLVDDELMMRQLLKLIVEEAGLTSVGEGNR